MRIFFSFSLVLFLTLAAAAADLTVQVNDPQSAAMADARVSLISGEHITSALETTSASGTAIFRQVEPGSYLLQVFAPGFAPQEVTVQVMNDTPPPVEISLVLATIAQTVVVTATQTAVPVQESGAAVSTIDEPTLEVRQPLAADDAIRFLPGAVINNAGRRGGQSSLFVRGGDSRYNKVIVDGVTVNDPGGTFDFGVVPLTAVDRVEFVRGAESTLYGSDAMTSVLQFFTAIGRTRSPEVKFGAEGGTFSTARGYASLAGILGRFDYNLFGDQTNTEGQGVNDQYSNSSQGANAGVQMGPHADLRVHLRHSNSRTGVQSYWNFGGQPLLTPDTDQRARQNNFLASAELSVSAPSQWQHHFSVFEYNHRRQNVDSFNDVGRVSPLFGPLDFPFSDIAHINRAGLDYRGEFAPRTWARSTFGYNFEDENGFVGDPTAPTHGLRRNHAAYAQQLLTWKRLSVVGGARFVHNESFGNVGVPHVAGSLLVFRGGDVLSGTHLRFAYGRGIKEPRLEESAGSGGGFIVIPNLKLKPEENRSLEAGVQQSLFGGKAWLSAQYFNNLFRNQIAFSTLTVPAPIFFEGQYVNVNQALAHGAEFEIHTRPSVSLSFDGSYTYTSTQILKSPLAFDPLLAEGQPLLRRPRHSGNMALNYIRSRWGSDAAATFIGRRTDSDFSGLGVDHAAGYARLDLGGWYAITHHVTGYLNVENALNKRYEEAAGYPALKANFRAGLRFRFGGE